MLASRLQRIGCSYRRSCGAFKQQRSVVAYSASPYKRSAAELFVETYVHDNMNIGLGTGELSSLVIEEIGRKVMAGKLKGVRGIPTTDASANEAAFHGLPLHSEPAEVAVDLAFEQADQVDVEASSVIIGVVQEPRQPQLLRMLTMAQTRAKKYIVLVEGDKLVSRLSGTLPVLIDGETWEETAENIDDMSLGDAEVWRRAIPGTKDPNPRGGKTPYITEEGHNILDLRYDGPLKLYGEIEPYHKIEDELMAMDGVIGTGLMMGVAQAAVVATPFGPKIVELKTDAAQQTLLQEQEQK